MAEIDHAALGRELYEALRSRTVIAPLNGRVPGITIEDSYHISRAMLDLRLADGETVVGEATEGLDRLYSGFSPEQIEASYVFRAPFVEPVWTRGYLKKRPAPRVDDTRLYLCTTAQAYPMITAWNTSVKLATEVTNAYRRDAGGGAMRAPQFGGEAKRWQAK